MARRRNDDDDYDDDEDDRKRRRNGDDDDDDDRPRGKKRAQRSGDGLPIGDYLFFRKMIGPPLVTIIFFLGVIVCLSMAIGKIMLLFADSPPAGFPNPYAPSKLEASMWALFYLFVAPIFVRGLCEGLACLMRMAESTQAQQPAAKGEKSEHVQEKKPAPARKDDDAEEDEE